MMKRFAEDADHIFLACGATDFRKQIPGLVAAVTLQFQLDPYNGNYVFIFCNRKSVQDLAKELKISREKITVPAHKRTPRQPGIRKEMLAGLPIHVEEYTIPAEDTCHVCGAKLEIVGKRVVRTEVEFQPAKLIAPASPSILVTPSGPGWEAKFCSTAMVALLLCTTSVISVPTATPSTGICATRSIRSVNTGLDASGFITSPIVSIPRNRRPNAKIV